uniref:HRDC domain-containing protein n=1 Tax=Panagrellus redivivus TaxID=6233 RepID=A0A7E4W9T1_PANRE
MAEPPAQPPTTDSMDIAAKDARSKCTRLRNSVNILRKALDDLPLAGRGFELCLSFPGVPELIELQRKKMSEHIASLYNGAGYKKKFPTLIDDIMLQNEANHFLEEKITRAIDQAKAEARGGRVMVPVLQSTAMSHMGAVDYVPESTPYKKDSGGRYGVLSGNKKPNENVAVFHQGLFVAKNLPKPQTAFQDLINNSDAPFVPKLRVKHHAAQRTSNMKVIDDDDGGRQWTSDASGAAHPYDYELETFTVPAEQKVHAELTPKKTLEEVPFTLVNDKASLDALIKVLNASKLFAVDLEHHAYRTYLGLTCLIQISTMDHDYVVDPFPIWGDVGALNEPFTDPKILKIFHGGDSDVIWLQRDFGIYVVNMFDTHQAMRVLGTSRLSYQYLVEQYCGITLGKELQKADWRLRPLTEEHIKYARGDTRYLLYCYEHLRNDLLAKPTTRDLLNEVYRLSANLARKTFEQPRFSETGYMKLVSRRRPTNQQAYALRALWKWRDSTAREADESLAYILPDHMLMQIAEVLPRERNGIISCCSPVPVYLKRDLLVIHRIMMEARDLPLDRSGQLKNTGDALTDAFTRTLADIEQKSFFEKRLEELFPCDCNVARFIDDEMDQEESENVPVAEPTDFVFVITEPASKNDADILKRLKASSERISEYATPYEAYQLALKHSEQRRLEEANKKPVDTGPKVTFSHHDEHVPRTAAQIARQEAEKRNQEEGEISDDADILVNDRLVLTRKAQKRRQQQSNKSTDVFIPRNGISKAKRAKPNVPSSSEPKHEEREHKPVKPEQYANIDERMFNQVPSTSGAYNGQSSRGKKKNNRGGRGRGRGRGGKRD